MSAKKPLIFVHPLSESLQKLHSVIEEIAEDEKIEIYDVDEPSEVAQLIPTVGQSLSIFGNPKKCAMVLQPNRKVINKLNSKVILLTKKSMPRKTMDKFSKIGLTECIVEPVAPKTLLYKVKLLLRSIVVQEQEEEEEYDTKFGKEEEEDKKEKQRLEKGVIADDEDVLDYNLKGKIKNDLEIEAEEEEKKKSEYKEEIIEKEWKGKVEENTLDFEEEKPEKKDDEESDSYIDAYLRGKKSQTQELDFEDDLPTPKVHEQEEEEEDDIDYGNNARMNLELLAEEDNNDNDKEEHESDDKYYKGKVSNTELDMEADEDDSREEDEDDLYEEDERKKESLLDLELDIENELRKRKEEAEEEYDEDEERERDEVDFELLADEDDFRPKTEEELLLEKEEQDKEEDVDLDAEDDDFDMDVNHDVLELEEEKKKKEEENEEEIDKYMRGDVAKTVELIDGEEVDARNREGLDAEEEDDEYGRGEEEKALDLESDDDFDLDVNHDVIELEDEDRKKNNDDEELELENDDDNFEKSASLDLEFENDDDNVDEESDEDDIDYDPYDHTNKGVELDLESDSDSNDQTQKEIEEMGDYNRAAAGMELDLEDDNSRKHSAHTEHIETNYDSRKSTKHQEYDWDIVNQKDKTENYDQEKKQKSDIQISFKEQVDLGEQTIDYRKLHSEFEAITINRMGNKKKRSGPKYMTADEQDIEYLKSVYGEDYEQALEEIAANAKNLKADKESNTIYHPNPQGLDIAVKTMNLYHNKSLKKEDIFSFIAESLLSIYGGHTFFFTMDNSKKEFVNSFTFKNDHENVDKDTIARWPDIKDENYSDWIEANLPKWHDEKFITEDNIFFYPIYEGANKLGFAVVLFNKLFKQENAKSIEIILETARGIVLDEFHKAGVAEKYDVNLQTEKQEKEGFLNKFLGRFKKKAS